MDGLNRRQFLNFVVMICAGQLIGCNRYTAKKGDDMDALLEGFNPFNGKNPNLKYPDSTARTFYENLKMPNCHAGIKYNLPFNEPILACAPGLVDRAQTHFKDTDEIVILLHGELFVSVYYHMREGSSMVKKGDYVQRGQPIALPYTKQGNPTKVLLHRKGFAKSRKEMLASVNSYRDDPDNYGPHQGYMEYFKGQKITERSFEVVTKRDKMQTQLLYDLIGLYKGPGAEHIPEDLWFNSPGSEDLKWSIIQVMRLMEHRFNINKNQFNAPENKVRDLIKEIYSNQPALMTLPLQYHA